MRKRLLTIAAAIGVLLTVAVPGALVSAHPEGPESHGWTDYDPADGPATSEDPKDQHGGTGGHLPPSSENVELVGKIQLTNVPSGIADVTAWGNYAYLNAWNPECAGRPGAAAHGPGTHVVDVSDPAAPTKVAFLTNPPNTYPGEGAHVISLDGRQYYLNNSEICNSSQPATAGMNVWDVTDPTAPIFKGSFGDTAPAVAGQTFHHYHSVQGFVWEDKAYAVGTDNQELKDVDIFDITPLVTGAGPGVLVAEQGLEDWPGAQGSYANGDSVFHHDMQQKVIDGHNFLLVSYWDAGQVLLNIDDPANPVFVTDSDYSSPDPEQPAFAIPEGNSHQSYFDQDGEWILSSDEDFSPTRTLCEIETGADAGATGCGEFGWTVPISTNFPGGFSGESVYGGSGCVEDTNGNGVSDRDEVPPATGPNQVIVFTRGVCFFSIKVESGQMAGYDMVAIANSHGGSRDGLLPDAFVCGGQGHAYTKTASAVCLGHRANHLLFGDAPQYTPSDAASPGFDVVPIGTTGEDLSGVGGVFDGWGYIHLHRNTTDLPEVDTYAIPESQDPACASGCGTMSVHEVKTDPRPEKDLAYFSWYDAGLRVAKFGPGGITEVGHYIAEGGNDFWGVYPLCNGGCADASTSGQKHGKGKGLRPLLLMSDRDSGLWIFRYTGKE